MSLWEAHIALPATASCPPWWVVADGAGRRVCHCASPACLHPLRSCARHKQCYGQRAVGRRDLEREEEEEEELHVEGESDNSLDDGPFITWEEQEWAQEHCICHSLFFSQNKSTFKCPQDFSLWLNLGLTSVYNVPHVSSLLWNNIVFAVPQEGFSVFGDHRQLLTCSWVQ